MLKMKALLIATALTAVSGTAQAAITVYTTQASFLAAVTSPGTDTFESLGIVAPTPSPITRAAGAYGYTAAASTSSFFGAGSAADHWLSTNVATDIVTFNSFTGGVRALGGLFFGSDVNGSFLAGNVILTATDASGTTTQTITGATTGSFLGFVSTGPLLSATLASVQGASPLWPTANNLILASAPAAAAVPEPATWGMMILGFGLAGSAIRRRSGKPAATLA